MTKLMGDDVVDALLRCSNKAWIKQNVARMCVTTPIVSKGGKLLSKFLPKTISLKARTMFRCSCSASVMNKLFRRLKAAPGLANGG